MTRESDDRRIAVLDSLLEHPGGVSGELLAAELGVSRVAVRKHITALREQGYTIQAQAGEGYTFVSAPDAPIPLEVRRLVKTDLVTRLEGGRETGSTNDDARALAGAGAPEGTVVLACRQTAGRGRMGRHWESPPGGVYASIVLRPTVETPDAVVLPLVVGLGVALGLESLGVETRLKWPNDLLSTEGRKIAGILLEGLSEGWRMAWIVAGIGVNVRRESGGSDWASVDGLLGRKVPLAEVAAAVLDGVGDAYRRWETDGFGPLAEQYQRRAWLAGREVCVSDAAGTVVAAGMVIGIDAQGRLLVDTGEDTVPVAAGEVTLRR